MYNNNCSKDTNFQILSNKQWFHLVLDVSWNIVIHVPANNDNKNVHLYGFPGYTIAEYEPLNALINSMAWVGGSIHVRYKNQTIKNRKLFEKERMRKDLLQNITPHTLISFSQEKIHKTH